MDSATALLVLQYVSFTVTTMMALLLVFTRIHTQHLSRNYEVSRWMLFAALMLDALHYQLQIHCGFRAMGDDVGALINILFYSPVLYIIFFVTIRMAGIRNTLTLVTSLVAPPAVSHFGENKTEPKTQKTAARKL